MKLNFDELVDAVKGTIVFTPPAFTFAGFTLEQWMYTVSIVAGIFLVLERIPRAIEAWRNMWRKRKDGSTVNED